MSDTETQPAPSEAPRDTVIVAEVVEENRVHLDANDDLDDEYDDNLDDNLDDDLEDDDLEDDDLEDDPEEAEDDDPEDDEEYERAVDVLREVIERQLIAGRSLSTQVTDAATDVTAALIESPSRVFAAVREGATLPSAFGLTGDALTDVAIDAGNRIRSAVSGYVNSQAALPEALITGIAEVAGSAVRAQGSVTSSALDAAFTVAAVATRDGDVRDTFDEEWQGLLATFESARDDVQDAVDVAQRRIQDALPVLVGED